MSKLVHHDKLDEELCFKLWAELGYQRHVQTWLTKHGKVNKWGKPYSIPAISYAARRWVCMNAEKARDIYAQHGQEFDDDVWNKWLVHNAVKVFHDYGREHMEHFLDINGLREEYGYIIGE